MPEMQNLNGSPVLVHVIVDIQRGMENLSDARLSFYGSAKVRSVSKQFEVVEKFIRELLGRFGMFLPRPFKNLFQIR
jgi:hypothetical protein